MSDFRPARLRPIERSSFRRRVRASAAFLGDEAPIDPSGINDAAVRDALERISDAIAARDLPAALAAERSLPPLVGAEPAIVDRLATLRLLEGDPATAAAALGAVAVESPRLELLRAIALAALEDLDELERHVDSTVGTAWARPGLALVDTVLGRVRADAMGYHALGDPSAEYCARLAGRLGARVAFDASDTGNVPSGARLLTIAQSAMDEVLRLLAPCTPARPSLARCLVGTIDRMARDLGLCVSAGNDASPLAVSLRDRAEMHLRAA